VPENGFSEGLVTRVEIAELAALLDRFEFALDPRATPAKEAESRFETKVRQLFTERVANKYTSVSFVNFYCRTKSLCRTYLRRNP